MEDGSLVVYLEADRLRPPEPLEYGSLGAQEVIRKVKKELEDEGGFKSRSIPK